MSDAASMIAATFVTSMANSSNIPVTGLPDFRSEASSKHAPAAVQPIAPAQSGTSHGEGESASLPVIGPRKLIRPLLPAQSRRGRAFNLREESAILAHQNLAAHTTSTESSHAEAFYFQKQVQTQTQMMIVLEDGERIEGCIEWYDHYSIKVRSSSRILIYKSAIKYIYKVGDPSF